jgi:gliding motility-associated-like protein
MIKKYSFLLLLLILGNISLAQAPLSYDFIITPPRCHGEDNAEIFLVYTGGTPPISWTWEVDGIAHTDINPITDLTGGYTIYFSISDSANNFLDTIFVPGREEINLILETLPTTCHGDSNGMINLLAAGGQPPYQYKLYQGGTDTLIGEGQNFDDLPSGFYDAVIYDHNGCEMIRDSIFLDQPPEMQMELFYDDSICYATNNGFVVTDVWGGNGPEYSYLWNTGDEGAELHNLTPGTYSVTATDYKGCSITATATISYYPEIQMDLLTLTPPTCFGDENGTIDVNVFYENLPNYEPFEYEWYNQQGDLPFNTSILNNIAAGNYGLSILDPNTNCELDTAFLLPEHPPITIQDSLVHNECYGELQGMMRLTPTNGIAPFTITNQAFGLDTNVNLNETLQFDSLPAANYAFTITDNDGCLRNIIFEIHQPAFPIDVEKDIIMPSCPSCNDGSIILQIFGGTPPYSVLWPGLNQTGDEATGLHAGVYAPVITDARNCNLSEEYVLEVNENTGIKPYSAFSPNGDGINDVWNIPNINSFHGAEVYIYNALGNEVFYSKGYNEPWDGTYNGKDLQAATYYYIIKPNRQNVLPVKGTVTIIR